MKQEYQDLILQACGASSLQVGAKIQTLWSGYGEIVRLHLKGCDRPSVVVKHVKFPKETKHPCDWNSDRSHMRKVRSYQVETYWYQNYHTNPKCRTPACLAALSQGDEMLIVLEDLDVVGYDKRRYIFIISRQREHIYYIWQFIYCIYRFIIKFQDCMRKSN